MKLIIAVGDADQAPKVEDLVKSEGADYDEELIGEEDTTVCGSTSCSSDDAGGTGHRRA